MRGVKQFERGREFQTARTANRYSGGSAFGEIFEFRLLPGARSVGERARPEAADHEYGNKKPDKNENRNPAKTLQCHTSIENHPETPTATSEPTNRKISEYHAQRVPRPCIERRPDGWAGSSEAGRRVIVDFYAICTSETAHDVGSQVVPAGRVHTFFWRHKRLLHRLPHDHTRREGRAPDRRSVSCRDSAARVEATRPWRADHGRRSHCGSGLSGERRSGRLSGAQS